MPRVAIAAFDQSQCLRLHVVSSCVHVFSAVCVKNQVSFSGPIFLEKFKNRCEIQVQSFIHDDGKGKVEQAVHGKHQQ